jgi:hypothetical protein
LGFPNWSVIYINTAPQSVTNRSATETQKHEIGAWEIQDRRGKLWRGAAGVISIPSDDSTFIAMMKRE